MSKCKFIFKCLLIELLFNNVCATQNIFLYKYSSFLDYNSQFPEKSNYHIRMYFRCFFLTCIIALVLTVAYANVDVQEELTVLFY
jgi:hypothetical protein